MSVNANSQYDPLSSRFQYRATQRSLLRENLMIDHIDRQISGRKEQEQDKAT